MLRITMSKSASGAKKYYCEQYYNEGRSAQLDYYAGQDDAIGKWGGKAARMLGLEGDIQRCSFNHLCDNMLPSGEGKLTGRNDKDRTVGYDFTFNASKSVSLAYAFGSKEEKKLILDAFQQAVAETMEEVESGMQTRVRAKGSNENRLTGNLVYGAFTHFTTRPLDGTTDPHLHSHCFVFNATYDETDKKWKAGQFRQINQDAPYYEAVFHATLAGKLQQAGYDVERTKNGFELKGLEKETLEKFSRRTQEIEDYAREHGITDDRQKSRIGANTREAKRVSLSAEQQQGEWLHRLSSEERAALDSLRSGHRSPDDVISRRSDEERVVAQTALRFSLDHHLERKSVASDKEILATAIKAATGEAHPKKVREALRAQSDVLSVEDNLRTLLTTKEALQEEKRLIRYCTAARNKFRPIYERYEQKNPLLNEQQAAAVRHALASTDGIILITGKAGTGKTTLMKEVQQGIHESGKKIFSFAPSSEASRGVQRSEGFDQAETVARLIIDTKLHQELKRQVIWIDEAGMLSNKDINQVLAIAEAQGARVILSGDTRQHRSVERGDALRIIQKEGGIKPVTVSKIQRQQQSDYKEAVAALSQCKVEQGFKKLDRMGVIHEIDAGAERAERIADEYYKSAISGGRQAREVLVIAPTHAEGDVVTLRIRQELKEHGAIGSQEQGFKVLRNRQLTEAEKTRPESYHTGDVLQFQRHSKGIRAGNRLEVVMADTEGLSARDSAGKDHWVAFTDGKKFTVYEPRQLGVAEGEKLRVTGNGKTVEGIHLFNGSTYQVEGFDQNGNIKLSNGSTLPADFGHFTHGYVTTSHAAQGKTADKVILSQSSATFKAASMEQFYVSVSRGRQAVSIYTDDKEQLLQAVSQSNERTSATELIAKRQQQDLELQLRSRQTVQAAQNNPHYYPNPNPNAYGLPPTTRTRQDEAGR